MKQRHSTIPMEYICRLLGKTVQTYYYHVRYQKRVAETELVIVEKVKSIRVLLPGAGVPKLRHMISLDAGLAARCPGRDTMYELLRSHHLLLLRRGRRGPTTTDSRHRYKKYPNLVRELVTNRPNELWVSDITYISTYAGFCYLSLITDAYSHRILGYHVHHNLSSLWPSYRT